MGALTLKNFPFELRGWEIQKFKSFDPTDGFLCSTILYLNKNKIVQIEPLNNWLSDKGRQYFDAIFGSIFNNPEQIYSLWPKLNVKIVSKIYTFEHCCKQNSNNYLFIIVFDFLSIELLGLLNFISKNYSFVALKQVQPTNVSISDLEFNFQTNHSLNKTKLINSNLCLLITTNPRYEGFFFNLNLRQRVLKKKFQCVLIGSLINLTFPVSFIGSNINIIKVITEGNHFFCQNFKHSNNPFLVCNNELFRRNDSKTVKIVIKTLFYLNFFNKMWFGFNVLNSSISETCTFLLNSNKIFKLKNLYNFSCVYFLNVAVYKIAHLKKITELQLLQQQNFSSVQNNLVEKKLIIDQNCFTNNNLKMSNKMLLNYLYIPTNTFYQNTETFVNTEGFIKKTNQIISKNKTKNNWQILRKFLKYFKNNLVFFNKKNNEILFFNSNKFYNFKNFINFQYCPIKKITNLSCYISIKNKVFLLNKVNFKQKSMKFKFIKLKYWLDDFFNTNKDKYSQNSTTLTSCSKLIKYEITNFF